MSATWTVGDQPPDTLTDFRDRCGRKWCEIGRSSTKPRVWYCDSVAGAEEYWPELVARWGPMSVDKPATLPVWLAGPASKRSMSTDEFDVGSEVILVLRGDPLDGASGRITAVHYGQPPEQAQYGISGVEVRLGAGRKLDVHPAHLRRAPGPAIWQNLAEQESAGWHNDWPEALTALKAVMKLHQMSTSPASSGPDRGKYVCIECTRLTPDSSYEVYPCRTVLGVAEGLGLKADA